MKIDTAHAVPTCREATAGSGQSINHLCVVYVVEYFLNDSNSSHIAQSLDMALVGALH